MGEEGGRWVVEEREGEGEERWRVAQERREERRVMERRICGG